MIEGWRHADFRECVEEIRSGKSVNSIEEPANSDQIGVLKTSCVYNGRFEPRENKSVVPEEQSLVKCPVTAGTIIVSRMNTADLVGASGYVDRDYPNIFLPDRLWAISPKQGIDPVWLYYVTSSPEIRARLSDNASGTSASMKNISQDVFLSMPARIPPLQEQRKIAEILRTWDEALEKLTALRAAKELQYRAFARKFFEPCHPSFHGHPNTWQEFELGAIFTERSQAGADGERLLSVTMNGGVIDRDDVGRKDTSNEDKSRYKLVLPGDIAYNTMRMWQGVSGLSTMRGIVSPAYTVVTPLERWILGRYAAHLFKSQRMMFDFERYSQGLTSDTWNLKFPAFSKIKVWLPPVDDQEKQANLLDTMSYEQDVLRRQIEAVTLQKRGLMQKLLTGEWRVPLDPVETPAATEETAHAG